MLSKNTLNEIENRLNNITDGIWYIIQNENCNNGFEIYSSENKYIIKNISSDNKNIDGIINYNDAIFIAYSPIDMRLLINEIKRLYSVLENKNI